MKNYKAEKIFIVSLFSLFFIFVCLAVFAPRTGQHKIFFRETADYMADYHNNINYSAGLNPYHHGVIIPPDPQERIYPPLVYAIFHLLGKAGRGAGISNTSLAVSNLFMFYCFSALLGVLFAGYKGGRNYAMLLCAAFAVSGIFIFSYERGNIIVLSAALSAFFIFNYRSKNPFIREAALLCLAFAAALKISPALLGLLLLFDKRWKEALRAVIYGAALALLPFTLLEGGFSNIAVWLKNIKIHNEIYGHLSYPRFNFRYWLMVTPEFYAILSWFGAALGITAAVTSFFQNIRWRQVMQLLLVFAVLPPDSGPYTALYLFAGIILFFNREEKEYGRLDDWFLLLFIALLNPLKIILEGGDVSMLAVNVSASVMLILLTADSIAKTYIFIRQKLLQAWPQVR